MCKENSMQAYALLEVIRNKKENSKIILMIDIVLNVIHMWLTLDCILLISSVNLYFCDTPFPGIVLMMSAFWHGSFGL